VNRATVSFRDKETVVSFEPDQVTIEQMIDAITGAGFQASIKRTQRSTPPSAGR
jgi:copper chaperone CopZ